MYSIYEVTENDTLANIAKSLGIDLSKLIELNGRLDNVSKGQLIIIPNQNQNYITYEVVTGDNLYQIAKKYGTTVDVIERLNGLEENSYIYPNQKLLIPKENNGLYITKENQTINELIDELGVNINDLLKNNRIYLVADQIITYDKKR